MKAIISSLFLALVLCPYIFLHGQQLTGGLMNVTSGSAGVSNISTDSKGNVYLGLSDAFGSPTVINGYSPTGTGNIIRLKMRPDGTVVWAKRQSASIPGSYKMTVGPNDTLMITGLYWGNLSFNGTTTFSSTPYGCDLYLAKFDTNGNFISGFTEGFTQGYGCIEPMAIAKGKDHTLAISGYFQDTITIGDSTFFGPSTPNGFLSVYGPNNTFKWAKAFLNPTGIDYANSVDIDSSGNIYVTGGYDRFSPIQLGDSTFSTPYGLGNYIVKFDPNGNTLWAKNYQSLGANASSLGEFPSLQVDDAGNCYMATYFSGTVQIDGQTFSIPKKWETQILVSAFDPLGNLRWARQDLNGSYVTISNFPFTGLNQEKEFWVCGNYRGDSVWLGDSLFLPFNPIDTTPFSMFIAKYATCGDLLWGTSIPTDGAFDPFSTNFNVTDTSFQIVGSSHGNFKLNGLTQSPGTFNYNPFLLEVEDQLTIYPPASFSYQDSVFCQSDTNPFPSSISGSGYFFTAGNIVFADSLTGEIDLQSSIVGGPFSIGYTTSGPCPDTSYFSITILGAVNCQTSLDMAEPTEKVQLFPNPNDGYFQIRSSSNSEILELQVFDLMGKEIATVPIGQNPQQVDLSFLSSGTYFLLAKTESTVIRLNGMIKR